LILLFDTGWNPAWMDRRFAEEGIDRLLQQGQSADHQSRAFRSLLGDRFDPSALPWHHDLCS
jgi:hypothetical protein